MLMRSQASFVPICLNSELIQDIGLEIITVAFSQETASSSTTQKLFTPTGANQSITVPISILVAFGTGYGLYHRSHSRPLLCEAPIPSEKTAETDTVELFRALFNYKFIDRVDENIKKALDIIHRDGGDGLLRDDHFRMAANLPCEDSICSINVGDGNNENAILSSTFNPFNKGTDIESNTSSGHVTSSALGIVLPHYIVHEILSREEPWNRDHALKSFFRERSPKDIDQAVKDAFLHLDRDIMNVATEVITGSRPLARSMVELAGAESGSCALLAIYDVTTQLLRLACVGDSRAVLGRRNKKGTWEAIPLSIDQIGYNKDEVARLRAEHPNEPQMIEDGRLLGLAVTRAFGDMRWKLSAQLQSLAQTRFFGRAPRPSLLSPPYLTAEPVITTTKITPENNDFLILASDGPWDHLSSEQAVELVGRWLAKNNPEHIHQRNLTIDLSSLQGSDTATDYTRDQRTVPPPDCAIKGRRYTNMKYTDRKNWIVEDENVGAHLARNALGGADEDLLHGLLAPGNVSGVRRMRDDMTI
ncbi:MAG: hypothetical protein Q9225_002601 [Loekoesia sp. 1 TL-2023]